MSVPNIPLLNFQLSNTLSQHHHTSEAFTDVISIDQLPKRLNTHSFVIVSSTKSWEKSGHWVMAGLSKMTDKAVFFCSLGHDPHFYGQELVSMLLNSTKKGYVYNDEKLQSPTAVSCGHFTCYVADLLCQGYSFKETIDTMSLDDQDANDVMVRHYYYEHMMN